MTNTSGKRKRQLQLPTPAELVAGYRHMFAAIFSSLQALFDEIARIIAEVHPALQAPIFSPKKKPGGKRARRH